MKRNILLLCLCLFAGLNVLAYGVEIDGIYYDLSGNKATVTYKDYNSYSGEVVIPESFTYNGITYSVTSIGDGAFMGCSGLTSVIINCPIVGDYMFEGLESIKEVVLGESVTSIGEGAFFGCGGLTDFYCYVESVPQIDTEVFNDTPIASATLHVPAESLEQYKATAPWSGFGSIVPLTDEDAIEDIKASKATTEIARYDIQGRKISTPQKGINIIHYSDGTTKRVMVK